MHRSHPRDLSLPRNAKLEADRETTLHGLMTLFEHASLKVAETIELTMSGREQLFHLSRSWRRSTRSSVCNNCAKLQRSMASQATAEAHMDNAPEDLVDSSSLVPTTSPEGFDPLKASRGRRRQLPPSRYQFRPPKYDRGPLHPHRPPPNSDPSSRLFVPGPFSSPHLEATYHNTIAPDILTLCYQHSPPGFRPPPKGPRLRPWDDSSPYHQNRQLRGPRGGDVLRLLRKPITFRNVPMISKITVHSYVKGAVHQGSSYLHVAGMVVQTITNTRVTTHKSKTGEAGWGLVKGKQHVAVTAEMKGEDVYHFLGKLINVVLPRIKDWKGVRATTGDDSGNLTFGLEPEAVAMFPEVEHVYDAYPPRMIPGCHITIHTTADADKDARLLLQAIGVPFFGRIVD